MARSKKNPNVTPDNPHGGYAEFGLEHLKERLALLKGVIPRRAIRKDCACHHFVVRPDGSATVAATDLEVRMVLKLEVLSHTSSGTVMVEAHALDALIGSYPEPRLRLHLDDPKAIQVEGLQTKLVLPGADPARELKAPVEGCLTSAGWMVRGSDLAVALERTRFATDPHSTRYALNGVALFLPEAGDTLEVVGTDGRRLAVFRLPVWRHGAPERLWRPAKAGQPTLGVPVLSLKAVGVALRLARLAGDEAVGLAVIPGPEIDLVKETYGPGLIQVVTRDAVLTAQVPQGRFPDFRDVFPAYEARAELRLDNARRLGTLLETAVSATDSEHTGVEMVLAGGCLMMTVRSETKGRAQLSLLVPDSEGRATVEVDGPMLRPFFDVAGDDPMVMRFFGPDAPLLLRAGPRYDFVIMPLSRGDRPAPRPAPAPAAKPEPGPDEGDGRGDVPSAPAAPEPVAPVAASPDAHRRNGKARPKPGSTDKT
jgi:DNA polymerase III sliding clamp (beta) subunit (PCNA family)